ncbi:MAG: hypothetical protein ACIARQ_04385 [Phycisphaerales bacterium JB061]
MPVYWLWIVRKRAKFARDMFGKSGSQNPEYSVKLGDLEDLMYFHSNRDADNPYNSLISLSSSGVPIIVGTLLLFYPL